MADIEKYAKEIVSMFTICLPITGPPVDAVTAKLHEMLAEEEEKRKKCLAALTMIEELTWGGKGESPIHMVACGALKVLRDDARRLLGEEKPT